MFVIKSPKAYLQRPGLRAEVGKIIAPFGLRIHIYTSPQAWEAVNPEVSESLERAGIRWQLNYQHGECTDAAIEALQASVLEQDVKVVLAIGGGRVLDCAKAVNNALPDLVLINFPTLAATCAAWSPLAIIYNEQGGHLRSEPLNKLPEWVLVDSEVIARSDVRYLKSGIVDALAKWYEFEPYQRQNPDRLAVDLKVLAAWQAVGVFERWGEQAVADNAQQRVTPALEKVIEANIVLAGLANSIQDELSTPGFAHVIHDRLTHQPEFYHWLHGEKVGFSLLVQSIIEQNSHRPDSKLLELLARFNTPLTLPFIGDDRAIRVRKLAEEIRFPADSLQHLPFTITAEKLEKALLSTLAGDFPPSAL
ncbi:iron-containing alcohol dehydrogenase family protein [Erwinia sp.]|uniref:iron-containing alcohol dehydrogenase family protein n=1 Tax=Erwinia citreus TaxID=558 RepID=UPI003C73FBB6